MSGLACNTTSISFEYSPVGTLVESQDIVVSNKTNEIHELTLAHPLRKWYLEKQLKKN